jgi:hypothetical protein
MEGTADGVTVGFVVGATVYPDMKLVIVLSLEQVTAACARARP